MKRILLTLLCAISAECAAFISVPESITAGFPCTLSVSMSNVRDAKEMVLFAADVHNFRAIPNVLTVISARTSHIGRFAYAQFNITLSQASPASVKLCIKHRSSGWFGGSNVDLCTGIISVNKNVRSNALGRPYTAKEIRSIEDFSLISGSVVAPENLAERDLGTLLTLHTLLIKYGLVHDLFLSLQSEECASDNIAAYLQLVKPWHMLSDSSRRSMMVHAVMGGCDGLVDYFLSHDKELLYIVDGVANINLLTVALLFGRDVTARKLLSLNVTDGLLMSPAERSMKSSFLKLGRIRKTFTYSSSVCQEQHLSLEVLHSNYLCVKYAFTSGLLILPYYRDYLLQLVAQLETPSLFIAWTLIDTGANVRGLPLFDSKVPSGKMSRLLYARGARFSDQDAGFLKAVKTGDLKLVLLMLSLGTINVPNATAAAAKHNELEILKVLVRSGARINGFALKKAAKAGNLDIVKYLVENRVIDETKAVQESHLKAVKHDRLDVAQYLKSVLQKAPTDAK